LSPSFIFSVFNKLEHHFRLNFMCPLSSINNRKVPETGCIPEESHISVLNCRRYFPYCREFYIDPWSPTHPFFTFPPNQSFGRTLSLIPPVKLSCILFRLWIFYLTSMTYVTNNTSIFINYAMQLKAATYNKHIIT
jgi:hypothetical protein